MIICEKPFVCRNGLKSSIACGNINYTYLENDILFYVLKGYCGKVSRRIVHNQNTMLE